MTEGNTASLGVRKNFTFLGMRILIENCEEYHLSFLTDVYLWIKEQLVLFW